MPNTTPRPTTVKALAVLAVPALLLTACGNDKGSASSTTTAVTSSSASASATPSASSAATTMAPLTPAVKGDLAGITVGGSDAAPTVKVDKAPFSVKDTTVKVVKEGSGEAITAEDTIVANAQFVSGKTGKVLEDTFAKKAPQTLAVKGWIPGVAKGLLGQKAGAKVLVAIAPQDGPDLIAARNPKAGISVGDTVLAYVDVTRVLPRPLKEATGTAVAPKVGMPTVKFEYGKPATITVPKTAAPTTLQVQELVQGNGAVVQKGQTVQVHYTGVTWAGGKLFDSNFMHGTDPTTFPIGVGRVIPGWDKAIVGKKVGSRLLIVAPPADGYGAAGNGPIPANSTLVFVVDILGAN